MPAGMWHVNMLAENAWRALINETRDEGEALVASLFV